MRKLLHIPILHEEVDLGSAGPALASSSAIRAGERRWALHQETVRGFWDGVERCLWRLDPRRIRVYQDGLAVDGALGQRVAEEAAKRGSRNYRLILALLERGAALCATEDAALLLEEHASLHRGEGQQPSPRLRGDLLARRDAHVAERINATLREGEVGVLFMGAAHNVGPLLAEDILVQQAKDPDRLRRYVEELLLGGDPQGLVALAAYVSGPVEDCGTME